MEDLRVIGVDDGALLVSTDAGARYRLAVDDALAQHVKNATAPTGTEPRISPREIQAHIRSGMSAHEVATVTGASLEYIQRFEGPILAEREFVIESARAVPVHTAMDSELGREPDTFGSAILARLHALNATGERWASWKEENQSWVIKLAFTAEGIDRDARWSFEPRKSALSPINNEAETLSRQGDVADTLIPRLRAVDGHDRSPDNSRFDSGAFVDEELSKLQSPPPVGAALHDSQTQDSSADNTAPHLEAVPYGRVGAHTRPDTETSAPTNHTADLLDALRRRRGERENASPYDEPGEIPPDHPSTGNIRLVDVPLSGADEEADTSAAPAPKSPKRGRASMPSWDEIVFGARSDDDPA